MKDYWKSGPEESRHINYWLADNCFGDYYTRTGLDYAQREMITFLFDRFYRPDASRTSKTGGHGIGLSIAKRIATLHNGKIEAVPSGDGLSFNVVLSSKLRAGKKQNKS